VQENSIIGISFSGHGRFSGQQLLWRNKFLGRIIPQRLFSPEQVTPKHENCHTNGCPYGRHDDSVLAIAQEADIVNETNGGAHLQVVDQCAKTNQ
jgi:hypothetical protein